MKKVIFILAIAITALTSCASDDSANSTPPTGNTGTLLKQVIESYNGLTVTSTFTYNGNKLTEISDDDGSGPTSTTEDFTYDANDRLIEITSNGISAYTFTYNTDGTITETESGGSTNTLTFANGNIVSENYINTASSVNNTTAYTFDTKNGVLKNIHQPEVFILLGYNDIYNNRLSVTATGTDVYPEDSSTDTYTYNSNNYPVTSTTTEAPGTAAESTYTSEFIYY